MKKLALAAVLCGVAYSSFAATPVRIETNMGNIDLVLDEKKAPVTVKNFVSYANKGHYNGTVFHRVIDGFMIQGGGYLSGFSEKATREPIKNEASNGLKNKVGTLAMARTSEPHSATSQFFINVADNDYLDFRNESEQGWGYCVFAAVVGGMDVVNKIKSVKTGRSGMHRDVPKDDVIIERVTFG